MNIKPNIEFIKQLKKHSNSPVKTCMQCGSCTVVCNLSPDDQPFPRKEMQWAGWGVKEKLMNESDIWLCHQCGDCSETCPRGVRPADVLASLRMMQIEHYAKPRFLGRILNSPALLAVAILIPAVIIALILLLAGTLSIPNGPVDYSAFFPHAWLNISFTSLFVLVVLSMVISGKSFWKEMQQNHPGEVKKGFWKSLISSVVELMKHDKFKTCETNKSRGTAHFLVFWGFVLLLFVTACAIVFVFIGNYPMGLFNPVKVAGNIAALMLLTGLSMMIVKRLSDKQTNSNYADWAFLIGILLLTVSGVLVEAARFLNWETAYHIYFAHLVLVWYLILYIPFTKFGHILYRTLSLTYAKMINRF